MELTYLPALPNDTEAIFQLSREIIESYEDLQAVDLDYALNWTRHDILLHWQEYTRILVDSHIAGYYSLQFSPDGSGHLSLLALSPPYRGQGLGKEVMAHCMAQVWGTMSLFVFKSNMRARRLYDRMGFAVVEEVGTNRLRMERTCP